jgi:integrase
MDYRELPQFMAELRQQDGVAARALEFLILVSARTSEVTGAVWPEIDFDNKMWVIPGNRMKGGREHRVPLCDRALAILRDLPREDGNPHVFIGREPGTAMSKWGPDTCMERLGLRGVVTIHGFRSSFSTWAHEQTAHASHTIEISLAHNVGSEVERAYRRTDMISKRARLLSEWGRYCLSPPSKVSGEVVTLRGGQ